MGCAFVVKNDFTAAGGMVLTTIVATTVIYELTGALLQNMRYRRQERRLSSITKIYEKSF